MEKILFYTRRPSQFVMEITCVLALSASCSFQFQSLYNFLTLTRYMKDEANNQLIIILTALSHDEVDELLTVRHMFDNIPTVLILPDGDDDIVHKGSKLQPCFIAKVNHDFNYVLSVVEHLSGDLVATHGRWQNH